jgi:solute carrier family 25 (mitochondrial aspartate/glutamate transporter), member 12/13
MKKATAVKEAVKESLLGAEEPVKLSAQTKARFNHSAVKDAETGELYMGPDEFIDAIAPPKGDYVSDLILFRLPPLRQLRDGDFVSIDR